MLAAGVQSGSPSLRYRAPGVRIVMMRRHREQQVRDPNSIDAAVDRIGDAADLFADAHGFAAGLPEVCPDACSAYHLRLR
jgi:hypothetical protein